MSKDTNSWYYKNFLDECRKKYPYIYNEFKKGADNTLTTYNKNKEIDSTYNKRLHIKNRKFHVYVPEDIYNILPFFKVEYENDIPAYILISSCEYSPEYRKDTRILDIKEKEDLIKFLKEKDINEISNWDKIYNLAQYNWNNIGGSIILDNNSNMPDYMKLPNRRELI